MFIMLCVRFLHICAMFFVWICLLHFLDIIISIGRVSQSLKLTCYIFCLFDCVFYLVHMSLHPLGCNR